MSKTQSIGQQLRVCRCSCALTEIRATWTVSSRRPLGLSVRGGRRRRGSRLGKTDDWLAAWSASQLCRLEPVLDHCNAIHAELCAEF